MRFKCEVCNDIYDVYTCRRYKEKFIIFDRYMMHYRITSTNPGIKAPPTISTRELERYDRLRYLLSIDNNNSVIHIMNNKKVKVRVIKGDGRIYSPQETGGCVHA